MTEPAKDNARLAERLLSIGAALRDTAKPPSATNGQDIPQYTLSDAIGVCLDMGERALGEINRLKAICENLTERNNALQAEMDQCLKAGHIWSASTSYPVN